MLSWLIWGLAASIFFIEYIVRVSPAPMIPYLIQDFQASATGITSFMTYYLMAYIAMQIPVGLLIDKYGPRILLTLTTALFAVCTLWFSQTDSLFFAQLARLGLGFSGAFAFVGALKLASVWFTPQRFSVVVGITQALGMVGGASGSAIVGVLIASIGWREALLIFGGILAVQAVLVFLIVRNQPKDKKRAPTQTNETSVSVWQSLKAIASHKATWITSLCGGFLYLPNGVLAELWCSYYLQKVHGFEEQMSNKAQALMFVGWAIGGPIVGFLSNHLGRRKMLIYCSIATLFTVPSILYFPNPSYFTIAVLLFVFGLFNSGVVAAYTIVPELHPTHLKGLAIGFANGMSVVVGLLCQLFIAVFFDWMHLSRSSTTPGDYLASELQLGMGLLVIGGLIAVYLAFKSKETLHFP